MLGDNVEDVDADLKREPICLKHIPYPVFFIIANVSVGGERRRSVSANDVPSNRCLGPLQKPAKEIAVSILQISPREAPVTRT